MKKSLLIGLALFAVIVMGVGVVYMVRKPTLPLPTPKPTTASAAPVDVFNVGVHPGSSPTTTTNDVCSTTFVVACASSTPSPSPSTPVSPTPSPSPSPSIPASASLDCVAKRMYMDDSRNRAGFYYTEQEISDTNTLQDGQTIVYSVIAKNTGGNSVPDTTITDTLSGNLAYVDGDSGCIYDATTRVVTCIIGALSAGSEASRSFRTKVSVTGIASVANTAEVASTNGQRDSCSVKIDATGKVVVPPSAAPTALPVAGVFEITAGTIGMGVLFLILGGLGLLLL